MPLCEHETRFNDAKAPGQKRLCGNPEAGIYQTINTLAPITVALCARHLLQETAKGRTFATVQEPPKK
jgi:hypothetical protein